METIRPMLPFLAPVVLLELLLLAFALNDLRVRARVHGPKWVWALVIVFVQILGPVAYFVFGRGDE